ncbi:hypothetical protein EDB83DRAFT_2674227 [Lactarius deliciosus]|nr:hypothetical protein EDB83DRAFT_2674227 [Lactarius deliciosus]
MRMAHESGTEAERESTETLAFGLEQYYRRETRKNAEGRATYEVPLTRCVDEVLGAESLEYKCPRCGSDVAATRRFATIPDALVVHANKFQLVNWVSTKLVIPVALPTKTCSPSTVRISEGIAGQAKLSSKITHPVTTSCLISPSSHITGAPGGLPELNQVALARLEGMGVTPVRLGCRMAFVATVNGDLEAAMKWLSAHMEDPDIDDSVVILSGGPEPSAEQVGMLSDMGFSRVQAHKALRDMARGPPERCRARLEWLFSHPDDMCEDEQPLPISSSSAEAGSRYDGAAAAGSLQKSPDPF